MSSRFNGLRKMVMFALQERKIGIDLAGDFAGYIAYRHISVYKRTT